MLGFSKKSVIGLDLGDGGFKMMQFKKQRNKFIVSSIVNKDIPAGIMQDGEVKQEDKLAAAIKYTLNNPLGDSFQGNDVVCNLPEEKVFIRIIQLPKMGERELNQVVKWETEAHIPLKINEVYLDWHIIKPVKGGSLDHLDILIAATPKVLVNSYLQFLRKSSLNPVALEPESVAAVRALISPGDLKTIKPTIIVDIGATGANFVIFAASAIRFTSHIAVSDRFFSQALIDKLKITKEEAHQLKTNIGLSNTAAGKTASSKKGNFTAQEIYNALEPVADTLADQIQKYILFYHNHASHIHGVNGGIAQVILCGGGSLLANLPDFLSKKLKLPVRLGGYQKRIVFSNRLKRTFKDAGGARPLVCAVGFGLALRSIL